MAYKALYRKYRPKSFDDVKGQDHIVQTLKNIILNQKISHAYLFSGPRGVGKTSVAKIFANVVNCGHGEDLTKLCESCAKRSEQNFDVIEMDAASNNGVNEIRDLRDKIQHSPASGNYKVYIIDEVHMLSKGAFNALLKTLEEPPAHAIFILATTDPQKIPLTILSRVQRYNFRKISNSVLVGQIKDVLDKESIKYEDSTINYIARLATGGMRDALSIVDQAAAYGNGEISLKDVMYAFGVTSNESLIQIANYLYEGKIKEVLLLFNNLKNAGIDSNQFVQGLIELFKDYLIYSKSKDANLLELLSLEELNTLKIDTTFAFSSSEKLYKLFKELFYTESPFHLIELYLIKLNQTQNNKEKTMSIDQDKMKVKKEDTIKTVLNQTQELVLEANKEADDNFSIDQDLLSSNFDVEDYDDGLVSTAEIQLDDEIQNMPKPIAIPAFDSKYKSLKSFKSNLSKKELINLLKQSTLTFINKYKSNLEIVIGTVQNPIYNDLISVLKKCKITAAGPGFMIFISKNIPELSYLQENGYNSNIQKFIQDYFEDYKHLYCFGTDEFKEIAKEFAQKMKEGKLDTSFSAPGPVILQNVKSPTGKLFEKFKK
ncbi:DNA polymerase III subunit gamma/tau [Mycoplasmopsis caviae]|uniref:DNA polymerase III subunit gamma/tau n=1 Tax=Mycoplasmopsis caviae TaxID=55603 RepID=A0A3P8LAL1_9BACT|nr:DNA polymerase III subunit gamma/tau [Mycoplasmopsis caviae]UUD35392.1 DNA polymerase III subunit gamma/tau [Mycoplasmopsis caviae]VDR41831.1 DNA-directed DNA polymerase [Mycoplasmopsis caviae]